MTKRVGCDNCPRRVRAHFIVLFKGKYLCGRCRVKLPSSRLQQSAASIGKKSVTLDKALSRVYTVKGYKYENSKGERIVQSSLCVPQILIGKKIKLVVVEE